MYKAQTAETLPVLMTKQLLPPVAYRGIIIQTTNLGGLQLLPFKTTFPDGKIGYSTIVVLLNKDKVFELISLAPNPVKNTAILSLTTVKGGKI